MYRASELYHEVRIDHFRAFAGEVEGVVKLKDVESKVVIYH